MKQDIDTIAPQLFGGKSAAEVMNWHGPIPKRRSFGPRPVFVYHVYADLEIRKG
jgi:hypothetical protein